MGSLVHMGYVSVFSLISLFLYSLLKCVSSCYWDLAPFFGSHKGVVLTCS